MCKDNLVKPSFFNVLNVFSETRESLEVKTVLYDASKAKVSDLEEVIKVKVSDVCVCKVVSVTVTVKTNLSHSSI